MKSLKNILEGVFDSDLEDQIEPEIENKLIYDKLTDAVLEIKEYSKHAHMGLKKGQTAFDNLNNVLSEKFKDHEITNKYIKQTGIDLQDNLLVVSLTRNAVHNMPTSGYELALIGKGCGVKFDCFNRKKQCMIYKTPIGSMERFQMGKAKTIETVLKVIFGNKNFRRDISSGVYDLNHICLIPWNGGFFSFFREF